jgi:signal transduction histidine kinase
MLGDGVAIRRALHNLVMNAVKHASDGRSIRLAVGFERLHGRQSVWISVVDRGPGIEAADLAHVFEPFYRGRQAIERQVPGNGLGLSLVRRVAEAHGGSVSVKSAVGEGSTFTLHLPA